MINRDVSVTEGNSPIQESMLSRYVMHPRKHSDYHIAQKILSDFIQIPQEMLIPGNDLLSLLRNAFTEIVSHVGDADYFTVRVILTAKNKKCQSHQ